MNDVDWDLLADHLSGALTGTPEEQRVADLIATDPDWARAASQLSGALDQVAADLSRLPAPEPMPVEVAARLDESLRGLSAGRPMPHPAVPASSARPEAMSMRSVPGSAGPDPSAGASATGHVGASAARPAGTLAGPGRSGPAGGKPGSARPGVGRPGRRRRAWWGAGLAVAAGVAAITAVGVAGVTGLTGGDSEETSAAGDAAESADQFAEEAPMLAEDAGLHVTATGTDYRPDSPLFTLAPAPGRSPLDGEERSLADRPESQTSEAPDPPLDRLWADPQACLAEVRAVHEPAPATVRMVDFARFQGDPAVVIWLTTGDGTEWVWVAGPECGTPGAGPDQLYQSKIR